MSRRRESDAADANDDGRLDLLDTLALLMHLFQDGWALPDAIVAFCVDPTEDQLGCATGAGGCG